MKTPPKSKTTARTDDILYPSLKTPLGVFDSGLGGLTIVRALRETLPNLPLVYLGDTARVPYGIRSPETIQKYALHCAQALLQRGVAGIVVACNTVSAIAMDFLRSHSPVPVFGVIEPGARAALQEKLPGPIGVLGTPRTIQSHAYPLALRRLAPPIEVFSQAAPLFVPLVEEGWTEGDVPEAVARRYLEPLLSQGCRTLALGCTHYPLLRSVIHKVACEWVGGDEVRVVDGAHELAREIQAHYPSLLPLSAPAPLDLLLTDWPTQVETSVLRFLGRSPSSMTLIDIVSSE